MPRLVPNTSVTSCGAYIDPADGLPRWGTPPKIRSLRIGRRKSRHAASVTSTLGPEYAYVSNPTTYRPGNQNDRLNHIADRGDDHVRRRAAQRLR